MVSRTKTYSMPLSYTFLYAYCSWNILLYHFVEEHGQVEIKTSVSKPSQHFIAEIYFQWFLNIGRRWHGFEWTCMYERLCVFVYVYVYVCARTYLFGFVLTDWSRSKICYIHATCTSKLHVFKM